MNKKIICLICTTLFVAVLMYWGHWAGLVRVGWNGMYSGMTSASFGEKIILFFAYWPWVSVLAPPVLVFLLGWVALRTKSERCFEWIIGLSIVISVYLILFLILGLIVQAGFSVQRLK